MRWPGSRVMPVSVQILLPERVKSLEVSCLPAATGGAVDFGAGSWTTDWGVLRVGKRKEKKEMEMSIESTVRIVRSIRDSFRGAMVNR